MTAVDLPTGAGSVEAAPETVDNAGGAPSPVQITGPAADQTAGSGQEFSAPVEPVAPPAAAAAPDSPVAADLAPVADATPDCAADGATAEEGEMSFAEMLAEHERDEAPHTRLSPGQRVSVRIVAITADTVFVSTGSKVDGIVDREELEVDGELPCAVGDMIDLYVVNATAQEVKLSKILRGAGSLTALEEARDAGLPVEGKVTGQIKGGYAIDVMKRRAFCPLSQIDLHPLEDPESPVGKTLAFLITRLEKGGRNIVVSRRALLEREQAENRDALLSEMHEGDVREGPVTRLAPFGAFVELAPGVEGLVHVSELSWSRIAQADEAVSPGDRLRVKVLGIAKDDKGVRISLSARQVTDDPWKHAADRLHPGDVVQGKVVRNAPFGAFVEVIPGVEGLVHLSELSYAKRVNKADEVVAPGDQVSVKIKDIDTDKRRISLSLRDAGGNPWDDAAELFAVDQEVTGTVEKRAPFGLFVTLAPGLTGLLPAGVMQASPTRKNLEKLAPGQSLAVRITQIDTEARRISLAPAGEESAEAAVERDWKKHAPRPTQTLAMGALGLAMLLARDQKKKK